MQTLLSVWNFLVTLKSQCHLGFENWCRVLNPNQFKSENETEERGFSRRHSLWRLLAKTNLWGTVFGATKADVLCRSDVLFQLLSLLDILTGDFSSSVFQPAVPVRSQSDSRRFGGVFKLRGLSSPIVTWSLSQIAAIPGNPCRSLILRGTQFFLIGLIQLSLDQAQFRSTKVHVVAFI